MDLTKHFEFFNPETCKEKLHIIGCGAIGSTIAENLVRLGLTNIVLYDFDFVEDKNIANQLYRKIDLGKPKVEVAKERILEINPNAKVEIRQDFFTPESEDFFDNSISYIVDAVDTVTAKIELVVRANKKNIPIISCMGTGNKLDPTKFEVTDVFKTSVCPLAKVMRKQLKTRGIKKLKVLYSKEEPLKPLETSENSCKNNCVCPPGTKRKCSIRNQVPGSISFVPSVAGLIISGEVIKDILSINKKQE